MLPECTPANSVDRIAADAEACGYFLWMALACVVAAWPWTPYWWLRVPLGTTFGALGFMAWHETAWTWGARKIVPIEQAFTKGPSLNPTFEHWGGPVE